MLQIGASAAELGRLPILSLGPGSTFDLRSNRDGANWDFRKSSDRKEARRRIEVERPYLVIGSPPCAQRIGTNVRGVSPEEGRRRKAEARVLLNFALETYELQLRSGRHFLHEQPAQASSWKEPRVMQLRKDRRVSEIVGDRCCYGFEVWDKLRCKQPAPKPARFLCSSPEITRHLSLRCKRNPLPGG